LGFYDKLVLGSGDALLAHGFYGNSNCFLSSEIYSSQAMREDQQAWINKVYERTKGSVGYLEGSIFHVWHGSIKNRMFEQRRGILKKYNFHPYKDIELDDNECWRWSSNKKEMHHWIKQYFWSRNEDGKISVNLSNKIKNIIKHLKVKNNVESEKK
jgi:hypothetical protein